jgi:hypothetical protein
VGTCIGKRNYRFFVMFLASASLSVLMLIVNLVVFILKQSQDDISQTAVIVIAALIAGLLGIPLCGFFLFHLCLVLAGSTTRELIKNEKPREVENQWCDVDAPLFDPFEEISQQEAARLQTCVEEMRQPMASIVGTSENAKTSNEMAHPK